MNDASTSAIIYESCVHNTMHQQVAHMPVYASELSFDQCCTCSVLVEPCLRPEATTTLVYLARWPHYGLNHLLVNARRMASLSTN